MNGRLRLCLLVWLPMVALGMVLPAISAQPNAAHRPRPNVVMIVIDDHHDVDPHEWNNLAEESRFRDVTTKLRDQLFRLTARRAN